MLSLIAVLGPLAQTLTGLFAGLLSAWGLGGGTLLLLWLTLVIGLEPQAARAVNLVYYLPVSASALLSHRKNGYLRATGLPWAMGGGMLSAALTAPLSAGGSLPWLEYAFGVLLLLTGANELRNVWKG